MGLVYAEIELINNGDLEMVRRNLMDQDEVKRMTVTALVDTRSYMLYINESIQEQLQLPIVEKRKAETAKNSFDAQCAIRQHCEVQFSRANNRPSPHVPSHCID